MHVKRQRGFSLVEILVAITILLILASLSAVALTQATKAAQATNAVSTMSAITKAERTYFQMYGTYAPDLASLGGPDGCTVSTTSACLLPAAITTGAFTSKGYTFNAQGTNQITDANGNNHFFSYEANATPSVTSGRGKVFCVDATETMRWQQAMSDPASAIGVSAGSCAGVMTVPGVSGPVQ